MIRNIFLLIIGILVILFYLAYNYSTPLLLNNSIKSLLNYYQSNSIKTIVVLPIENYSNNDKIASNEIYNTICEHIKEDPRLKLIDDKVYENYYNFINGSTIYNPNSLENVVNQLHPDLVLVTRVDTNIIEFKIIDIKTNVVFAFIFSTITLFPSSMPSIITDNYLTYYSGWVPQSNFRKYFEARMKMGSFYPVELAGRIHNGWPQYYCILKYNKGETPWWCNWGLIKHHFDYQDREYKLKGFKLSIKSSFIDETGTVRYNGIWLPK